MYALPVTYGSNDLRSAPQPRAPQSTVTQLRQSDDPFARPIVLITMATYMASGFTKKLIDSLNELFNIFLAPPAPLELPSAPPVALPSALQLCSPAPSELPHPQPISTPVSARSYTPSPSVETMEEAGYPLRNIKQMGKKQMRKKHGASKKTYTSRLPSADICVGLPTKFGGSYMCFSRDKDLDA